MGWGNPSIAPSAAAIAALTDAQANSVAAATYSSTARIRSMTRVAYTLSGAGTGAGPYTWDLPISVTDITRCQIALQGFYITGGGVAAGDFAFNQPSVYAVSNTIITLVRLSNSFVVHGFLEVMEWV